MATDAARLPGGIDSRRLIGRARRVDLAFAGAGLLVMVVAMAMLMALVLDLLVDGLPRLSWDFFTNFPSRRPGRAGILSAWVGTTLVMIVTAALAVPLGVAAGVYLEEYAAKNWITDVIEINVTNLAGVPSIIYGLLALGLFVYGFGLGETILVAGMVLALLTLPVVIVATREAIRSIPQEVREAAFALGADQWQTVRIYILPAATPGILTGAIIGLARAIGETAPVITIGALTFIAFLPPAPIQPEFPFLSFEWLNSPFTVMPIQMFNWISRPQPEFHVNAAAAGLVLLAMTLLMNGLAIYIRYRIRKGMR
jgi:phosphate transport system permease protein